MFRKPAMIPAPRSPVGSALWLICYLIALPSAALANCTGASHFSLRGGEAFDSRTGLTWKRCSEGRTWQTGACVGDLMFFSLDQARARGADGWRMPTIAELASLLDRNCQDPPSDTRAFPDIEATEEGDGTYWSSSAMGMLNLTYTVDFINGIVDGHSSGISYAVRLVRDRPR